MQLWHLLSSNGSTVVEGGMEPGGSSDVGGAESYQDEVGLSRKKENKI